MYIKLIGSNKRVKDYKTLDSTPLQEVPLDSSSIVNDMLKYIKSVKDTFIIPVNYLTLLNKVGLHKRYNDPDKKEEFENNVDFYYMTRERRSYSITYEGYIGKTFVKLDLVPVDFHNQYFMVFEKSFWHMKKEKSFLYKGTVMPDERDFDYYSLNRKNKPALIEYDSKGNIQFYAKTDQHTTKVFIDHRFLRKGLFEIGPIYHNSIIYYLNESGFQNPMRSVQYIGDKLINVKISINNINVSLEELTALLGYKKDISLKDFKNGVPIFTPEEMNLLEMNYI